MIRFAHKIAIKLLLICVFFLYGLLIINLSFWSALLNDSISVDVKNYRILGETHETLPFEIPSDDNPSFRGRPKIILSWNHHELNQEHLNGCPDWNCKMITDRSFVNDSHAVIFFNHWDIPFWPKFRSPDQYYVFISQESPVYAIVNQPYFGFYNLTMGYRRDSDLPCPYGYVIERNRPLVVGGQTDYFKDIIAKKRKFAAWMVSNCLTFSGRSKLVQELQNYVRVDVYGRCGTNTSLKCAKTEQCYRTIERDYKFYFAFENSICKDYISEKFWRHVTTNVVVVVLKRSVVEPYVPKNSFIAVDDFRNAEELANYLKLLDANDELYANYLNWKIRYRAIFLNGDVHDVTERPWGFCRLCKTLWQNPLKRKSYFDIREWWEKAEFCDIDLVDKILNGTNK